MDENEQELHSSSGEDDLSSVDSDPPVQGPKRKLADNDTQTLKKVKQSPINKKNELLKPPTVEELNDLKMTENLYNNSLFRLQIEELVKEVSIKQKRVKALKNWMTEALKKLPQGEEFNLSDIKALNKPKTQRERFLSALATNYQCHLKTDQDLRIILPKPQSYESFGLYENGGSPGPHLETSINIVMPKECFHVKDFLNNRYLVKRFFYLVYIAENLQASKVQLELVEGNPLLPILHVQPTDDDKLTVKIYATPCEGYFKPPRFLPSQNNVKKDVYESGVSNGEAATIFYNSTLAHDITLSTNIAFVKSTLQEQPTIQEGIKLLSIWLRQRELDQGFGGFSPMLALYFVAYLVVKKKINKFMSSYQVVRNFWSFMVTTNLAENPISLAEESLTNLELFKSSFSTVFLDKTGCYNLMAFLSPGVYKKIRLECQLALNHLEQSRADSFHCLFLDKVPFALQYDLILDVSQALPLKGHFISTEIEKTKYVGFEEFHSIYLLTQLLQKGLNKRLTNLVPHILVDYPSNIKKVLFGLNLNADHAFNFIEMGPPLSDVTLAEEFRQFWGHLASDRRFRDGSTNVAVYFKTRTIRGKRGIVKRIIKYLLSEKLKLQFWMFYDDFEEVLLSKKLTSPYPLGTNEEASLKIVAIADELGQMLRGTQMSLSITGVQGISEAFSYTQPFPPIACKFKPVEDMTVVKGKSVMFGEKKISMIPRFVEPLEMVLQLEHSSKWPNNLQAVRHIKTSFYLEISKMLLDNHKVISRVTKDYLEVFYRGLVFRYTLFVGKEVALMKKESTESGGTSYVDNQMSEDYERRLNVLPKVNAALKGLQMQWPSFGPGTALSKRWLRCHLIDEHHLPDVVVDLFNASLYLGSTAFPESCTPQVSFLRFLKFVSEFQWDLQPLIVNFNEEISKEDLTDIETRFQQNRSALQPLYIVMPYDQGQSIFTRPHPCNEILSRVQQLAKASLEIAVSRVMRQHLFDIKEFFRPNLEGYHLLIHLKPLLNPRRHEHVDCPGDSKIVLEAYEHHPSEKIPINGFDPVALYLRNLRDNYRDFAAFFHDSYGGNVVGVLWYPKAREGKDFKVANINGRRIVNGRLELNEEALIDDFYLLGKGLVKYIEKR